MQVTLDFPDPLKPSETDLRTELAVALFQQKILLIEQSAHLINLDVDDFYQLLVDRQVLTPPSDPDDTPDELVLAHLRISLQQISDGKTIPLSQLALQQTARLRFAVEGKLGGNGLNLAAREVERENLFIAITLFA